MGIFNINEKKYDITFISRKDSAHFAEPILSELKKKYVIQYLSLRSFSCLFIKQRPLYSPIKSSVKWGILNIMQICTLPCIISHLCICIIEIGGAVFSSTQELLYVTKVMC